MVAGLVWHSAHSPPKLGGDALAQRGLGQSVQRRTVPNEIKREVVNHVP